MLALFTAKSWLYFEVSGIMYGIFRQIYVCSYGYLQLTLPRGPVLLSHFSPHLVPTVLAARYHHKKESIYGMNRRRVSRFVYPSRSHLTGRATPKRNIVCFSRIDRHRPTDDVSGWTFGGQAFKALGSPAKEGMRANKFLREEMALQEVGGCP